MVVYVYNICVCMCVCMWCVCSSRKIYFQCARVDDGGGDDVDDIAYSEGAWCWNACQRNYLWASLFVCVFVCL